MTKDKATVLVAGGGGREHELARSLSRSAKVNRIVAVPGNPGIGEITGATCVEGDPSDSQFLISIARRFNASLVVIGPEAALASGVADAMRLEGIPVFGPSQEAAQIESSKTWARELCAAAGIPSPRWVSFEDEAAALNWLVAHGGEIVVKLDSLAAGKGVTVASTVEEAVQATSAIFSSGKSEPRYGASAPKVLFEEVLKGVEASFMAFVSGSCIEMMPPARDHKRAYDGDAGPNTGGMGAFAPAPDVSASMVARVRSEIIAPAVKEMAKRGIEYRGVLYAGVMITASGPKLIEFNARFGDPETQVVLPLLKSDAFDVFTAVASGEANLDSIDIEWNLGTSAACVVVAAPGYPGPIQAGGEIELPPHEGDRWIIQSGTSSTPEGVLRVNGGRVVSAVAAGANVEQAATRANALAGEVRFPGAWHRSDIGVVPSLVTAH